MKRTPEQLSTRLERRQSRANSGCSMCRGGWVLLAGFLLSIAGQCFYCLCDEKTSVRLNGKYVDVPAHGWFWRK